MSYEKLLDQVLAHDREAVLLRGQVLEYVRAQIQRAKKLGWIPGPCECVVMLGGVRVADVPMRWDRDGRRRDFRSVAEVMAWIEGGCRERLDQGSDQRGGDRGDGGGAD